MLSRNAFNALLKTLEEPPAHVKFLFATTEADKLPVTVLSRCQRFDLRRIETPLLASHFAGICAKEGVAAEEEALAMIAAAAEGSVRDGLSILDQAIAHADLDSGAEGGGAVRAATVRDMLGLADRSVQRQLFAALLGGDGAALLALVKAQHALGIEPQSLLRAVLALVHKVTVAQIAGQMADAASAEERAAIEGWAGTLSAGQLHRLWQLLLKGHEDVRSAPDPLVAAEMALLRVMHAADMPDPGTLARELRELASRAPSVPAMPGEAGGATTSAQGWPDLVARVEHAGALGVAQIMRDWVRVVALAPESLRYALAPGYPGDPSAELRDGLLRATGQRWQVELTSGEGAPSLREIAEKEAQASADAMRREPLVEATLAAFPEAELIEETAPAAFARGGRNWSR